MHVNIYIYIYNYIIYICIYIYMPHSSHIFPGDITFSASVSRRYARLRLAASPARPEAAAAAGHRPEAVGAPGDISESLGIREIWETFQCGCV